MCRRHLETVLDKNRLNSKSHDDPFLSFIPHSCMFSRYNARVKISVMHWIPNSIFLWPRRQIRSPAQWKSSKMFPSPTEEPSRPAAPQNSKWLPAWFHQSRLTCEMIWLNIHTYCSLLSLCHCGGNGNSIIDPSRAAELKVHGKVQLKSWYSTVCKRSPKTNPNFKCNWQYFGFCYSKNITITKHLKYSN